MISTSPASGAFISGSLCVSSPSLTQHSSYTNRLITAKDHASIQLNVVHVDANGVAIQGEYTPFVISGFVRNKGESDSAINLLAQKSGLLKNVIDSHQ